jgi:hypothetical protein
MKHIKNFKLFEGMGDNLNDNNFHLELLRDLSLDINDLGFEVDVRGYESYKEGYNMYDIFIERPDGLNVCDINKDNLSKLKDISKELGELNKLNDECLNLITRAVDNNLYLCVYEIDVNFKRVYIHIRFTNKKDGESVGSDYKYYDEDDLY